MRLLQKHAFGSIRTNDRLYWWSTQEVLINANILWGLFSSTNSANTIVCFALRAHLNPVNPSCVRHSLVLWRNEMGTMMYVQGQFIRLAYIIWSRYSTMALLRAWEEQRTQWLLSSWSYTSQQPPVCYTEGLQHPERVTGLQVIPETWSWVLISE